MSSEHNAGAEISFRPPWNFFCRDTLDRGSLGTTREGDNVSDSKTVAQHLPLLRRYARALTGDQASGDAYVAATLEA